ncbi:MAG: hypothetical protein H0X64_09395 [Gemmatimonadaceae bacterium]|nr:hypothetical protein [Gemmatimonadaceae bacterium]
MREYRFQATDATIEALRLLKAPWVAATLHARSFVVRTAEAVVRLSVEREDVESVLEAQRIRADVVTDAGGDTAEEPRGDGTQELEAGDLAAGRNDVVLFTGETWVEEPPLGHGAGGDGNGATPPQVLQLSGRAGQRPESATTVCTTTDAIVVAAGTGEGILVRIGARPMSLEVVQARVAIARFLVQRGYTEG